MEEGKQNLIEDLYDKKETPGRNKMIEETMNGYYSILNSLYNDPEKELIAKLQALGYADMVTKANRGYYEHDE